MKKVTKIAENVSPQSQTKLKVAAYCRVSTDNSAQLESLDAQRKHYETYITSRKDWEYAGIYYDEGITDTKTEKRTELNRLIADCERGLIDFIITKSISRFSRKTTDCLELVRKLLDMNIPVFFEKENINTGSMESELFLSILSSMAEEESVSISQNNKWGIQKRFMDGTYKISYPPYGYTWDGENMVIISEQAAVVKRIFSDALAGIGTQAIATALNNECVPTKKGGRWTGTSVRGILTNEKYTGDVIFQKTYTDCNFNRHTNTGQKDQYMMTDHHEAIISHEDFEKVSSLLHQHATEKGISKGSIKYQNRYAFSGNIICTECNNSFKRRIHSSSKSKYVAWCCNTHLENPSKCTMLYIRDDDIKCAFTTMMNKLIYGHRYVLKPLYEALNDSCAEDNINRIRELEILLFQNAEQKETLTKLMAQGYIDQVLFNRECNALSLQAENYKSEKESLSLNVLEGNARLTELTSLLHFVKRSSMLTEYDEDLFKQFVKRIIVFSRDEIGFELKCGLLLRERM